MYSGLNLGYAANDVYWMIKINFNYCERSQAKFDFKDLFQVLDAPKNRHFIKQSENNV